MFLSHVAVSAGHIRPNLSGKHIVIQGDITKENTVECHDNTLVSPANIYIYTVYTQLSSML